MRGPGITPSGSASVLVTLKNSCFISVPRFTEGTYEPRTTFLYNNLMFVLLGHVAELLAGRNFEDLVQTEIFDKVLYETVFCDWRKCNPFSVLVFRSNSSKALKPSRFSFIQSYTQSVMDEILL